MRTPLFKLAVLAAGAAAAVSGNKTPAAAPGNVPLAPFAGALECGTWAPLPTRTNQARLRRRRQRARSHYPKRMRGKR